MSKLLSILFITFTFAAQAQWSKIPSKDFLMAEPPKVGSEIYEEDFKTLYKYQEERTEEQCDLANQMRHPSYMDLFTPIDDEVLTDEELESVKPLIEDVIKFTERVSGYYKRKFERPRPFITKKDLQPCLPKKDFGKGYTSYPSSHASTSMAAACVLAEVFPNKTQEILDFGQSLGELRVIVGVHHPSDIDAGQQLGMDICERLFSEEDFQKEFKDIAK